MDHYSEYQYKKKYFNPLVPKFRSHFLPLKSSNTCVFSIFRKNWSYWTEFSQFYICLAVSHTLTSSFRRGTLQIWNTFYSVNCLPISKDYTKQNSFRRSTRIVLPRVPHAKSTSPSFIWPILSDTEYKTWSSLLHCFIHPPVLPPP